MNEIKNKVFKVCPKTGRVIAVRRPEGWRRVFLPLVGFLALVWFLIRVVPKPARAAYPCQRVAAPLASGFVLWLAGMAGASVAFRHARGRFQQARYLTGALAVLIALIGVGWAAATLPQGAQAGQAPEHIEYTPHPANQPIGVAKGLSPGRVAWSYDPPVTVWNGTSTTAGQRWYDQISQPKANEMMEWALTGYAGAGTSSSAWDAIFRYFNGGAPYQAGEKVFIKINLTTSYSNSCADSNYNWTISCIGSSPTSWTYIGQSPQLMIALLNQLVNVAGVAQANITIGDSTGLWVNELYNPVHTAFPNVHYMDARGTLGRTAAARSNVPLYWSTSEANGKNQDYILQAIADAKYVIDFAILKVHERNGITVTAKNHFGSLSGGNSDERKPPTTNYYNIHLRLPLETDSNAWPQRGQMAQYRPLVDLNGHQQMGGKTLLYMIDGIYGGKGWNGVPSKWAMAPFNGQWPASLFLSMDQVAIDSVAFDFLSQQWPDLALANEGVQDYMHEMALADNPPSGTFYDPEHDGVRMTSQGVHEHWNNPVDKQYTRNLGTGNGIELVRVQQSEACGQQTVLFIGSTNPLENRDQILVNHLATSGYGITVRSQTQATAADALDADLIIISDSVDSTNVNTKFRDLSIPVMVWESSLFDDMNMTGTVSNTDYGSQASQTQVNIVSSGHPLAAGLPAGLVTTTAASQSYLWGKPSATAAVAARIAGSPDHAAIFGYDAGDSMVGMKAPARRVGFFNGYGSDFTANGWALYDAAVKWALECGSVSGGFSVVNADTGEVVRSLNNGDTLELTTLPANIAFRANTDPAVTGSVVFNFDGSSSTDNSAPYQYGAVPLEWTPDVGQHTISAQPFSAADGGGTGGEALSLSFTVTNTPLAVALAGFDATPAGDHVLVTWETVSEIDNAGFNLYRSATDVAPEELLVNMPSQAPGSAQGAHYTYQDFAVQNGQSWYYWLEAVDLQGGTSLHGPVNATVQTPTAVTIRDLQAGVEPQPTGGLWLAALAALVVLAGAVWQGRRKLT
ncbi:MAG: DUF362 domain-containing protein [Anaerolineales bacterium]|nr:DUF362 domain-containing protein [Anaerolineales bacterium]